MLEGTSSSTFSLYWRSSREEPAASSISTPHSPRPHFFCL